MDPKLRAELDRIADLNNDELDQLEHDLVEDFDRIDGEGASPANVQAMDEVAAAISQVRSVQSERAEASAEADRRAEELRSQVHGGETDEGEGAEDEGAEGAGGEGSEDDGEGDDGAESGSEDGAEDGAEGDEGDDEGEGAEGRGRRQPIAASTRTRRSPARPALGQLSRRASNGSHRPRPREDQRVAGRSTVRAMANAGGKNTGDAFDTFTEVVEAMNERIRSLGRGSGEKLLVARVELDYPEERQLGGDSFENTRKMDSVASLEAVTASGGICAPVDVDYNILVVADDDEPVASDLPGFQATRGGIRFITPPTLAGVGSAGSTIWTHQNDAAPGGANGPATKPVQTFQCGVEQEVLVDAFPTRFRFGNMMARFSPEIVEANTKLALANAARLREVHRLNTIASFSTSVSSGQLLGAARDFLATLDQVGAAYRRRHRIKRGGVQLRVILPDYMIDLVRADLTREMAHGGDDSNLTLTDADVNALLLSRGIAVTWTIDSQPAGATGLGGGLNYVDQTFSAPQGQGAILDWPHQIVWYCFAEGTFQRLDGGTLDLGVVRDSTLDSTNDYETFVEIFEGIAMRGTESLQVISSLRPNGASAGTVGTAPSPVIY